MKILITESTQVNFGDDDGGQHVDFATIVDAPKAESVKLITAGRALYVNRSDDPSKGHINTATSEMLDYAKAIEKQRKADAKKSAQATPENPPPANPPVTDPA